MSYLIKHHKASVSAFPINDYLSDAKGPLGESEGLPICEDLSDTGKVAESLASGNNMR